MDMTQQEFAVRFGLPLRSLQNWERRSRRPEGAVRVYLTVIKNDPAAVLHALAKEASSQEEQE